MNTNSGRRDNEFHRLRRLDKQSAQRSAARAAMRLVREQIKQGFAEALLTAVSKMRRVTPKDYRAAMTYRNSKKKGVSK